MDTLITLLGRNDTTQRNVVMLSAANKPFMLNVVMLNVNKLNVVAPLRGLSIGLTASTAVVSYSLKG